MFFSQCPRCGDQSYELLESHVHCVGCNFSPDQDYGYLTWLDLEYRGSKYIRRQFKEESRLLGQTYSDYSYGGYVRGVL